MLTNVRLAVKAVLDDNPNKLSAKEIAARMGTGVAISTIYSWGDAGQYGADIPLERIVQFTLITGDARPMAALCGDAGFLIIPSSKMSKAIPSPLPSLKALKEFGEFMNADAQAMLDGGSDFSKLKRAEKEGYEALLAVAGVLAALRQAYDRQGVRA